MKLLNPIKGYLLASGHPFYHVAFFLGSYGVWLFSDEQSKLDNFDPSTATEIEKDAWEEEMLIMDALKLLRYAHLIVFGLAIIADILNIDSEILQLVGLRKKNEEVIKQESQNDELLIKTLRADGSSTFLARVLRCFAVFIYQACIIHA